METLDQLEQDANEILAIDKILEVDKLAREGLREMGKDQLARNKLLEEK